MVLVIDSISARVRRRIISGRTEQGPVAALQAMSWWQRSLAILATLAVLALTGFILYQFQRAQVAG